MALADKMKSRKNTSLQSTLFVYSFIFVAVALLVFSHLLLKSFLLDKTWCSSTVKDGKRSYAKRASEMVHSINSTHSKRKYNIPIPELKMLKFRYDDRQMLRIFDYYQVGKEWENLTSRYKVCFSTQTSIERIYWLPAILKNWKGPLSLAVHITSEEEWLTFNLFKHYLSACYNKYLNQISIHLTVPINITTNLQGSNSMLSNWDDRKMKEKLNSCSKPKEFSAYLLSTFLTKDKEKLKLKEVYPQNQLRNIARQACSVQWTYSADIDAIPSIEMADKLQEFFENREQNKIQCEKCAFVIPTFELKDTLQFPQSKKEIVQLYKNGDAQYFHIKCYPGGHKATDFVRWTSTNIDDSPTIISHAINLNTKDLYEPFYISTADIPPFDERFIGYGFTRNSQFKAAYLAGWNFTVLTPVFSIHWGFQSSRTVLSPKKDGIGVNVRNEQTHANEILFGKILLELELKQKLGTL